MHAHMTTVERDRIGGLLDRYHAIYFPAPETEEQDFRDQMWSVLMADAPDTGTLTFRPDTLELTTTTKGLTNVTTVTWCEQKGC